jgi:hypothetical protein
MFIYLLHYTTLYVMLKILSFIRYSDIWIKLRYREAKEFFSM